MVDVGHALNEQAQNPSPAGEGEIALFCSRRSLLAADCLFSVFIRKLKMAKPILKIL